MSQKKEDTIAPCKRGIACKSIQCHLSHASPGAFGAGDDSLVNSFEADQFCRAGIKCRYSTCRRAHPSPSLWLEERQKELENEKVIQKIDSELLAAELAEKRSRSRSRSRSPERSAKSQRVSSVSPPVSPVKPIQTIVSAPVAPRVIKHPEFKEIEVASGEILVFVETFEGEKLSLAFKPSDPVELIKNRVQEETGLPTDRQRVLMNEVEIPDITDGSINTLESAKIEHKSHVYIGRMVYTSHAGRRSIDTSRDRHGNALGSEYDLGHDSIFRGCRIAVLHFYTMEGFDFRFPAAALEKKGFEIIRWTDTPPSASELDDTLQRCSQLWIISASTQKLTVEHLDVIERFFHRGHGLYLWGDNDPYHADANFVSQRLFGCTMRGCEMGYKHVGTTEDEKSAGIMPHMVSTGIERIFEGVTVATVSMSEYMQPLLIGSANNLITATYDRSGMRAILDGAFTRLYVNWDDAGTARFVINAACWLVNHERFGERVFQK